MLLFFLMDLAYVGFVSKNYIPQDCNIYISKWLICDCIISVLACLTINQDKNFRVKKKSLIGENLIYTTVLEEEENLLALIDQLEKAKDED